MSRHEIPALDPQHTVTVGWDNPMGTFFAIVTRAATDLDRDDMVDDEDGEYDEDVIILRLGGAKREYLTPESMIPQLGAYAVLTEEMMLTLRQDRAKTLDYGPTRLQRFGRSL